MEGGLQPTLDDKLIDLGVAMCMRPYATEMTVQRSAGPTDINSQERISDLVVQVTDAGSSTVS